MTEKLNKSELQEDFLIDKIADKVSKSKLIRALFGVSTIAGVGSTAACVTPPPAEVAPVNEAVLSGVIGQESVDKLSGNSKIIVENSLAYIANKYAEDENFVAGTEMIYAVGRGTDSFAWYLAGFENEDGSVGLRVTDYCDSFVRDNENCQNVERDLLMVEGEGNRLYGFVDENNEQHPILLIDKNDNPTAFDVNSSSYAEKVANSNGFVERIVSIGAMNVQAAAPEATVEPTVTLPIVDTPTSTAEPTATVVDSTPTAAVAVDELGIRKEFARGEVMTKEEIKANVDWFYNLSDEELNKIVEGNLFSSDEYPNDSRPRDIDGNVLSNKEDLGWFYSKNRILSGGLIFDSNYVNTVYLGTTYVRSEGLDFNVSAHGSLDNLGNKIIIYAVNGIRDFGVDYFAFSQSNKDRVFSVTDVKPISERTAIGDLLNNYMRKVVMIDVWYIHKAGSLAAMGEEGGILFGLTGGQLLIDGLTQQRNGVDSNLSTNFGEVLSNEYSLESIRNFVFINSTSVFRDK